MDIVRRAVRTNGTMFLFPEIEEEHQAAMVRGTVESTEMLAVDTARVEHRAKELGAYYTDSQVADFLVWWAVRDSADTVVDPSFGGGVFLRSAGRRIRDLGGDPGQQVFGVELDGSVHSEISLLLGQEFQVPLGNLPRADFFEVTPGRLPKVDVVVGNPPFIRYQRFAGEARRKALVRASEEGLKLSGLASSWLPFLIHSIRFLRDGGRLAMVIPFEIGHAAYARPVLAHLARRFESVNFLTFRRKLFTELSEDTLLLLAEGCRNGAPTAKFRLRDLAHVGTLSAIEANGVVPISSMRSLNTRRLVSGVERLVESLIPAKAANLYRALCGHEKATRLGNLADVGIGYVTGANSFFHFSPEEAQAKGIPAKYLRPCVRRGRSLTGLRLTKQDWRALVKTSDAGFLLELPGRGALPEPVKEYIRSGEQAGIHRTFKCSNREPWYRVPHVYQPDAFLTYMSGDSPKLVANDAEVVAPNSLHILRLHPAARISSDGLAALWQTTLTQLSVEIEGHALGGGLLKLEPTEAESVLLPFVPTDDRLKDLAVEFDEIARTGNSEELRERADQALLRKELGLSSSDIRLLHQAARMLRERRTSRSRANE